MDITVSDAKLFNYRLGMARRIVKKRDAMSVPLLGFIRLSADEKYGRITFEANDLLSGIRVSTADPEKFASVGEGGSLLLSEAVCDWLKGAKQPFVISTGEGAPAGMIRCGRDTLILKDPGVDAAEFIGVPEIPEGLAAFSVPAQSFCRGLLSCAKNADPATLTSQGVVLECADGSLDISSVSASGVMMTHYRLPVAEEECAGAVLDASSMTAVARTVINHAALAGPGSLSVCFAPSRGCWISGDGLLIYSHCLSGPGFSYRSVADRLSWEDCAVFSREDLRKTLARRRRAGGSTLGLVFRPDGLSLDGECEIGSVSSEIGYSGAAPSGEEKRILLDARLFTDAVLGLPDPEEEEVSIRLERENAERSPVLVVNGAFTAFIAPRVAE